MFNCGQMYFVRKPKKSKSWIIRLMTAALVINIISVVIFMLGSPRQATVSDILNMLATVQPTNETHNLNFTKTKAKPIRIDESIWFHPELDLLNKKPLHFLRQYKNPCWYEPLYHADIYNNHKSTWMDDVNAAANLAKEWRSRLAFNGTARRLRCLPYFFIIGQPKCGSTDLFTRILQHPDVVPPPFKEPHWWTRTRMGEKNDFSRLVPLSEYTDFFDQSALKIEVTKGKSKHRRVTGEASVSTMWDNDNWWRLPENQGQQEPIYTTSNYIKHLLPNLKIIVILRNPIERLFSDYLYFDTHEEKSAEDFHRRVKLTVSIYKDCFGHNTVRHCIYNATIAKQAKVRIRLGLYSEYLKDWLKVFSKDQILIIFLEEYSRNIVKLMDRVFTFLDLKSLPRDKYAEIERLEKQNKGKYGDRKVHNMFRYTKKLLQLFYGPFNRELINLIGKKSVWN